MTRHQSMAQNLSDMECSTFEIDEKHSFASSQKSPRYNRSNVCEQKLYPVWFSWRRVNILTLKKVRLILINLLNVAASFHVCENTVTKQNLQPNK